MQRHFITFTLLGLLSFQCSASFPDSLSAKQIKYRKTILISSTSALAVGSLIYLNQAWYKDYNSGSFHFFNDNREWLQMDKMGHLFSTYQTGRLMMEAFDWAHYNRNQKLFIAGGMGLFYMTAIECMDGFSEGWGFSWGDETANLLGAALAVSQEAFWGEQRIQLKFFYQNSGLAQYNTTLLGEENTRMIKDYNGQSYWMSINPSSFMKRKNKFPRWLNVAFGYGAYGMLGATANPVVTDQNGNPVTMSRYRRFYLSLDLDLTRIKVKSKFLKGLFSAVNIIKFPAPTLEYSQNKFQFHAFYP